jgi:hypothetical protein
MATGNPAPVEEWAPMFMRYWKKEHVLDPAFAITFGHCKLCDDRPREGVKEHMATHRKQLNAWLAKKERAAERKRNENLKTARKEKQLEREYAQVGGDEDDD